MLGAACAWGVYSLRGRVRATHPGDCRQLPAHVPTPCCCCPGLPTCPRMSWGLVRHCLRRAGIRVGYAIWYTALPSLRATTAATVQLACLSRAQARGLACGASDHATVLASVTVRAVFCAGDLAGRRSTRHEAAHRLRWRVLELNKWCARAPQRPRSLHWRHKECSTLGARHDHHDPRIGLR